METSKLTEIIFNIERSDIQFDYDGDDGKFAQDDFQVHSNNHTIDIDIEIYRSEKEHSGTYLNPSSVTVEKTEVLIKTATLWIDGEDRIVLDTKQMEALEIAIARNL